MKISAKFIKPEGRQELTRQVKDLRGDGKSWKTIEEKSPVPLTTIRRWSEMDMSAQAQEERQIHVRGKKLLTDDEKAIVIGCAITERANGLPVTQSWTRQTINDVTAGRVVHASDSFISQFWSQAGWPSRLTQSRSAKEMRSTLQQECTQVKNEVMHYITEHQIPSSRVHVMDETGLWGGSVAPRTSVNPATNDASVLRQGEHNRDTGIVTLTADGSVDAEFLAHSPQRSRIVKGERVITERGVAGVGTKQMNDWADGFCRRHGSPDKSVLILDRLAAHRGADARTKLEGSNITPFFMPSQAARIISPCDNSFFSSMKARLACMNTSTRDMKRRAFLQLYQDYPREIVRKYFTQLGWDIVL